MTGKHNLKKFEILKKAKIKQQLYFIYLLSVVLPISIIGSFLVINTSNLLTNYHRDLLESDNLRVRTILFEITTQIYNISEDLALDEGLREMLRRSYYVRSNFENKASEISLLDSYRYNHAEIDDIEIYVDNLSFMEYKQFHIADKKMREVEWFQKACSQSNIFWYPMKNVDKYENEYWNLCLVRKIPLKNTSNNAVLVIKISDNYLRTRINSEEYAAMISVDDGPIFYSSDRELYGKEQTVPIDYEKSYFQYMGTQKIGEENCFVDMSTLRTYQSDSKIYVLTMNDQAYSSIRKIVLICLLIIVLAVLIPGFIIHFFTEYFTSRVSILRQAMHQASNEDYEIVNSVRGQDELSEAFSDLEIMVQKIKKKDADMYEARINEKELAAAQQAMEFKMLASQINPHFLYNTLETIRMKAFTVGDREVATAIKLLGKSMRYVLENIGTSFTTLSKELEHVETYLAIQKLRFGKKFDSVFELAPEIDLSQVYILPLLLQPIVENAILHGLEERETGGLVKICIYKKEEREREHIMIEVSDNGCGMTAQKQEELMLNIEVKDSGRTKSIGLYNINQRLKLSYGQEYRLKILSRIGEGTMVQMSIPVKQIPVVHKIQA